MKLLVAFVLGAGAAAVIWPATADIFAQPLFARRNVRGIDVPVGAGVVIALAAIAVEALLSLSEALGHTVSPDRPARVFVLLVVVGFALLGLFDDLAAAGDDRGFAGHLRALAHGRLTTGGVKLVGGGLLAVVAGSLAGEDGLGRLLLAAAVIALAANAGNLFDRAPGRVIKVVVIAAIPLFLFASTADRDELTGVAIVVGGALGLLVWDLRERLMLGDAGANALGATLGFGLVLTTGPVTQVIALVLLVVLNVASERVSFSQVIDSVAPLRYLDRLGRRAPEVD